MFFITSWLIKITSFLIKTFKLGNGFTWPGHLTQKIYPSIWSNIEFNFPKGIILISGTNGKTTTSALLTHLLRSSGYSVTSNASGANLLNGILTSAFLNTNLKGDFTDDFAVLEVDEFNLPRLLKHVNPDYLILTNLSRDQLDRYGEVDTILYRWKTALNYMNEQPILVLNRKEIYFRPLLNVYREKILFFGNDPKYLNYTSLVGSFNAKNLNAAVLVAENLGLPHKEIVEHLETFEPAFGRGELINALDKNFYLYLAKNPASFNTNLKMLLSDYQQYESLLFILNDKIPDGRDVSWIYDIDSQLLSEVCKDKNVYVSGTRSLDMQIRLDYAGVSSFISLSKKGLPSLQSLAEMKGQKVVVLPNYSSMLEFRQLVKGKNIL